MEGQYIVEGLKSCPFFGDIAIAIEVTEGWEVQCRSCDATGPWIPDMDSTQAIEGWNKRS